jgi:hypothetical protein
MSLQPVPLSEPQTVTGLQLVPLSELQEVVGGGHHKNDGFSLVAAYNQPPNNGPEGGHTVVRD